MFILKTASRLDAFSVYPCRTWLPSNAPDGTTRTLEVRPSRSSRTREEPSQHSAPATDRRPNCLRLLIHIFMWHRLYLIPCLTAVGTERMITITLCCNLRLSHSHPDLNQD